MSAGGFIAEASDAVDSRLKTIAGKLAYLIGGAQILFSHEPVAARVRTSSGRDVNVTLTIFAMCKWRLIGGGRLIAPDACIDDGLFDVSLIEQMPTVEFLGLLKRVSNGEHGDDERVAYFRTPDVDLTFARRTKVNTDGEVLDVAGLSIPPPASGPAIHCALAWAGSRCADHHVSLRGALELGFRSRAAIPQRADLSRLVNPMERSDAAHSEQQRQERRWIDGGFV